MNGLAGSTGHARPVGLFELRADLGEFLTKQGIRRKVMRQLREQPLRVTRPLLAQRDDPQQDLGKRAEEMALFGNHLQTVDTLLLIAINVIEFDEPLHEEREAA